METDVLREIVMLAEKRSYAATADALFISSSSLSRHIAAMEQQLGVPLFRRSSRSVQVSRYGEMLLPYARKITQLEEEYLEELDRVKRSDGAGLRVGAYFGLAAHGIMTQVAKFIGGNRDVALSVQSHENDRLAELLRRGKCDLAFVQEEGPSGEDEFSRLTVAVDTLVAALPANHMLSGAESVRLAQLRDEAFLLQADQSIQYRLAIDAFRRAGYDPKRAQAQVAGVGMLELVEQGLGVALAQGEIARQQHCAGVALVPLDPPERVWINLIWHPENLSEVGKAFVAHFRDNAPGRQPQP